MTTPRAGRLAAEDAQQLVSLTRRVYGEAYPDRAAYDASAFAARLQAGTQVSVGVWFGRLLVGHMTMRRRRRPARTADAGWTMVDPSYRGARISGALSEALNAEMSITRTVGFHHYPVTVNTVTQRLGLDSGGIACGFMLC